MTLLKIYVVALGVAFVALMALVALDLGLDFKNDRVHRWAGIAVYRCAPWFFLGLGLLALGVLAMAIWYA